MKNKRYKRAYLQLITRITEILAKHDLLGLVSGGSPRDEYSEEATLIVANLRYSKSVSKVDKLIADIYKEQFGNEYSIRDKMSYEQAEDIFSAYKDFLVDLNK